jgi:hypothetical protein
VSISWKHIAIFACIFTPLGFVAWLIRVLSNSGKWCGVIVGFGKLAGARPAVQDCTPVLLALIDELGMLATILAITSALGLLTWIVMGLRARLAFRGPGGFGGEVGGDDGKPVATVTTTTAVTTPSQEDK